MSDFDNLIRVNANIEMTVDSLHAIVTNAKKNSLILKKEIHRVDTAKKVSEIVSRFLHESGFEHYVNNFDNYK